MQKTITTLEGHKVHIMLESAITTKLLRNQTGTYEKVNAIETKIGNH